MLPGPALFCLWASPASSSSQIRYELPHPRCQAWVRRAEVLENVEVSLLIFDRTGPPCFSGWKFLLDPSVQSHPPVHGGVCDRTEVCAVPGTAWLQFQPAVCSGYPLPQGQRQGRTPASLASSVRSLWPISCFHKLNAWGTSACEYGGPR